MASHILNFKGDVFDEDHADYDRKRQQYASSTYDEQMKPKYVAYPTDTQDVQTAIKFAKSKGLKVIARSGGHQYCGVSCDNGALILSMNLFNRLEVEELPEGFTALGPDGNLEPVSKRVYVGVGNRLKAMVNYFKQHAIAVPHGECASVGIGGHTQTGGYGHLMRTFGLCIDYVYAFTIITADGEKQRVSRDSTGKEQDLYWAVLGGSQGAFGVTTEIEFHPIVDTDYNSSTGYLKYHSYDNHRAKECITIFTDFCNRCQETDENPNPPDIDMMMSIGTKNTNTGLEPLIEPLGLEPSVIIMELVCKAMKDEDEEETPAYTIFRGIMDRFNEPGHNVVIGVEDQIYHQILHGEIEELDGKKHYTISELNLAFTRKNPLVTKELKGEETTRESIHPYIKATYGGNKPLPKKFIDDFSKLVDDVRNDNRVHLVCQVGAGGGAYKNYASTSLPHRTSRYFFTFDLFRKNQHAAIALEFMDRFKEEIVHEYFATEPEMLLQWASSPENLDMTDERVWKKYYDNDAHFERLQEIKTRVDPTDLFSSRITIRPIPNTSSKRKLSDTDACNKRKKSDGESLSAFTRNT